MTQRKDRKIADLLSLQYQILGLRVSMNCLRLCRLAVKANFDPDQPRNPKRSPGAGRWRRSGPAAYSDRGPRLARNPRTPAKSDRLRPPAGIGHNRPPKVSVPGVSLENAPNVPSEQPRRPSQRTKIAKRIAHWIVNAVARRVLGPVGVLLDVIEVVQWIQEYKPSIQSYFDQPKTLEELRSYADEPEDGYEIHHIVERTSAARDGFSRLEIEGYDNLVRVPTYKHHEITTWYGKPNPEFAGQTPRQYLAGKPWDERVRVGLQAMRELEVVR